MPRRTPDPLSLVFGFGFLGIAATVIAGRADLFTDAHWVWPAVLVIIGAIILAATVGGRRRAEPSWAPPQQSPPPAAPPAPTPGDDSVSR